MEGLSRSWLQGFLRAALDEDLGAYGDVTSEALFAPDALGRGHYEMRQVGVLAGAEVVPELAALLPGAFRVELFREEGAILAAGEAFARVEGPLRGMLAMERVALNLIGRLSGIATLTARFVEVAAGRVEILDTRKTTPLLRPLEKYAVRVGGGRNHRFGLNDAAMIKDNHRAAAGAELEVAMAQVRRRLGHTQRLVVEVESLEGARVAAAAGADVVLLDNMGPEELAAVAAELAGRVRLEASGGVTLETLAAIAASGVHAVSVGALTHSAPCLDVAFELEDEGGA